MMEVVGALEVAVAVGAVVVLQVQRLYGCSLACSSQLPCSWSRHLTHVIGRWWCWILTFNKEGGANGQSTRQCQYTYYTWKRNSPSLLDLQSSNTCHAPVGMSSPINIRKLLSTCLDVSVLQQFLGPKITRNRPKDVRSDSNGMPRQLVSCRRDLRQQNVTASVLEAPTSCYKGQKQTSMFAASRVLTHPVKLTENHQF